MADLNDLANAVDKFSERLPVATNNLKKSVSRLILTSLTQTTPADTGAAISNWQVDNQPIETERAPFVASPKGRVIKGVWTHAVDPQETAHANAPAAYEAGTIKIEAVAPGEPLFIGNPLPYIRKLDQGSSNQAPTGMVDQAIILAKQFLARARLSF